MRSRSRLYSFIGAVTVTASLAVPCAATASVTVELGSAAAAGCAQATFDGVKGSGDGSSGGGMGTTVATLAAAFRSDLAGSVTTTAVPVAYPAVPVLDAIDDGLLSGVNYPISVARGVSALDDLVRRQLKTCPSTRVVLAGYSQGADVVETYLASNRSAAVRDQIAAVGLLGDPRFNPSDPAVDVGSFNPKYGPIFGKFGIPPHWNPEGRRPLIPAPLSAKTISACNEGDPSCNYSWSNMVGCLGINAWDSFYASIIARDVVLVPDFRASCAHLHYIDPGSAGITAGSKVTVTAIGQFLAAKVQQAPWTVARAPLPVSASSASSDGLGQVACASAYFCVAVGNYSDSSGSAQGLLERLSGTTWTAAKAPVPSGAAGDPSVELDSVACPSSSTCVAVGNYSDSAGNQQGLVETLSGTTWTATKLPHPAGAAKPEVELGAVACPTTSSCVAAGSYTDSSGIHALLATRSGTTWRAMTAPQPADAAAPPSSSLDALGCASASSCVAGGSFNDSSGRHEALLETLSGTTWAAKELPPPADAAFDPEDILYSVACPSASACAGVGYYTNSAGNQQGLVETLAGAIWTASAAPLPAAAAVGNPQAVLYENVCPSASSCAAVGYYLDSSGNGQGLLLRRSGATWAAAKAPLPANAAADPYIDLSSVACSTASFCVAVGDYTDASGGQQGLLETLSGRTWTVGIAQVPADATAEPNAYLDSAACPSASRCVAVGGYRDMSDDAQGLLVTGPG
jgi:hypothetical protein